VGERKNDHNFIFKKSMAFKLGYVGSNWPIFTGIAVLIAVWQAIVSRRATQEANEISRQSLTIAMQQLEEAKREAKEALEPKLKFSGFKSNDSDYNIVLRNDSKFAIILTQMEIKLENFDEWTNMEFNFFLDFIKKPKMVLGKEILQDKTVKIQLNLVEIINILYLIEDEKISFDVEVKDTEGNVFSTNMKLSNSDKSIYVIEADWNREIILIDWKRDLDKMNQIKRNMTIWRNNKDNESEKKTYENKDDQYIYL
jgi:hypothetical protein